MESLPQQAPIAKRQLQQRRVHTTQTFSNHSTTCYDVLSFGQLRAVV